MIPHFHKPLFEWFGEYLIEVYTEKLLGYHVIFILYHFSPFFQFNILFFVCLLIIHSVFLRGIQYIPLFMFMLVGCPYFQSFDLAGVFFNV